MSGSITVFCAHILTMRSRKRRVEAIAKAFGIPMSAARATVRRYSLLRGAVRIWPKDNIEWIDPVQEATACPKTPNETSET